ncbi:MAG: glycosyltransferase family 4 protein, partial [Planctomycetota bacterium]
PSGLGSMTLSMLRGEEGRQAHELKKLIDDLQGQPAADVILLSNVMLIGMARRLKQALGVPVICSLQGEAPFLDALDASHRDQAWETLRERAADIDAFVPVSHWYGDLMAERLGLEQDRVHVVHNGIDPTDLAAVDWSPPAAPTVGYLARMCADKGLPTLVEAFVHLVRSADSLPDLRLRIAGVQLAADRPLVQSLRRRLADAGLAERVEFLPNLERAQKIEFLGSLSVLSVPATYGESFGLYLLEALAAGVPLVQPRHGAFPEILSATGGGLLCEPDDPVDLARALGELLSDERAAREFAERGRSVVLERFTEDVMAEGVEAVCKMVAAR